EIRRIVREEIQALKGESGQQDGGQLLTAEQVAELWEVAVSKVREMARRGELPHVRLGHYMRFRPEDLNECARVRRRTRNK
ncbi:MAG: helix-turn-helix domain-containing protein, partial [Candidatus Binatia bacterium]